ncbi:c-type cytochrome [Legionella oakridgensis]|uniref:Cytochrome c5 n=2 Tax=Legionella oakridgensis TaxID=29423 RepID=W0BBR6_9GAMM|nr:c-type cytochrome [Legionella oakridgensis]AHE66072.1 cytochrome c5 [Legionella oakridgensis ATCC 33761 = DSM 21215]ETO94138.1 cytochrome c5 [Legionella oakridgensis RV-2-2007]KTD43825.1 cytochrome c5 [Legionella oakridgensis]STY15991.1 cytochrome c5 [Legionella longbeachae]
MRTVIFVGALLLPMALHAESDFYREQIQQRISPIGKVRIQNEGNLPATVTAEKEKEIKTQKTAGQETYEKYCVVCHREGVAGAPKFRVEADWKSRLDKQGIDGLTKSAMKGLNAMPPKGTCVECSEADIKATVEYMVPQS